MVFSLNPTKEIAKALDNRTTYQFIIQNVRKMNGEPPRKALTLLRGANVRKEEENEPKRAKQSAAVTVRVSV